MSSEYDYIRPGARLRYEDGQAVTIVSVGSDGTFQVQWKMGTTGTWYTRSRFYPDESLDPLGYAQWMDQQRRHEHAMKWL